MSVFETLNNINVNGHTEKKNGLTYLSWAWAWAEVKKAFPDATYTIYEAEGEYGPRFYFTDGYTAWVKTGVTINGIEHIEMLPVMDFKNKSIPLENITSTDVNKAIQRSLTKACARHGLGLYIYAGEDLPEEEANKALDNAVKESAKRDEEAAKPKHFCSYCGKEILPAKKKDGTVMTADEIATMSLANFGAKLCSKCMADPKAIEAAR